MDITMALNVQDNTAFQLVIDPTVGSALKGRGNGMLNLHINPGNGIFNMYGDYTLIEGSFLFSLQNIISKKFIIESGSMIPVDQAGTCRCAARHQYRLCSQKRRCSLC